MLVAVLGTRPEAIKLGPVIEALRARNLPVFVLSTGQHTDLLAQTHLPIDQTLDIPHESSPVLYGQAVATALRQHLSKDVTVGVIVQGDTASAWGGARGARIAELPLIHIEAGIRSGDITNPRPEEEFRIDIDRWAHWHFCATEGNKRNIVRKRFIRAPMPGDHLHVTGNPGIDALYKNVTPVPVGQRGKTVLVTLHRRESWGEPMTQIVQGINAVAKQRKDLQFIVPCHPNGEVEKAAKGTALFLTDPMPPEGFQHLLARAQAVITDSGGVQEEAAALGIPCVVARDVTDRPESVETRQAHLAGRTALGVQQGIEWALVPSTRVLRECHTPSTVFGDGHAADRIADILGRHFAD